MPTRSQSPLPSSAQQPAWQGIEIFKMRDGVIGRLIIASQIEPAKSTSRHAADLAVLVNCDL